MLKKHDIPLCKFDLTDLNQVLLDFAPKNHQWLTVEENQKKRLYDGSLLIAVQTRRKNASNTLSES